MLMCELIQPESVYIKIAGWTIPFLLGLFASFFIDKVRSIMTNRKNRKFIRFYLKNSILKNLPKLKTDFTDIRNKIETYNRNSKSTISAHEDFNTNVLKGITSIQYYAAFNDKFILLNEIISMIEFISQDLPSEVNNDFYSFLDSHLKEKNKIGDMEHVKTCEACREKKDSTLAILTSRINEVDILIGKIEKLIK